MEGRGLKPYYLDTSLMLRLLTGDPPELAAQALEVFRGAEEGRYTLAVHPLAVAEAFYTLVSFYGVGRAKAAGALLEEARTLVFGGRRALELYAGSGLFSLLLSPRYEEVVAVEISKEAVRRGEMDRKRLGAENVRFLRMDARKAEALGAFDLVVVDPPRAGLPPEVRAYLLRARPREILYVSCDPATWARDVGALVQGGYRLAFARPYDFFPFTHHVEVLSLLRL